METCVERRAYRVVFTVFLLVLNTVIAETLSPEADTDNPLSNVTETFFTRTTGVKQTSWPEREATATAVDLSSGPGEMTDIPASVSITGAREGKTSMRCDAQKCCLDGQHKHWVLLEPQSTAWTRFKWEVYFEVHCSIVLKQNCCS